MKSHAYQIINANEQEQSLFFMLNGLLMSRIDTKLETDGDEDVNIYLANLLHDFLDFSFLAKDGNRISWYRHEVDERIDQSPDLREAFWVYRSNGDYVLMTVSILGQPLERRNRSFLVSTEENEAIERGRGYYSMAATTKNKLSRKRTGPSIVFEKISQRFEDYVRILDHMRGTYLGLNRTLTRGEQYHLEKEAMTSGFGWNLDNFLDAYGEWLETKSLESKSKVNKIASHLRESNQDFRFEDIQ